MLEFDATFLIAILSFVIFMMIMNRVLYKPITKIIGEREKFYEKNRNILTEKENEIEAIKGEKTAKIAKTHKEALEFLADKTTKIKSKTLEAIKAAREEMQAKLAVQDEVLNTEKSEVLRELDSQLADFVQLAAQKVLEKEVDKPDIKGIIRR